MLVRMEEGCLSDHRPFEIRTVECRTGAVPNLRNPWSKADEAVDTVRHTHFNKISSSGPERRQGSPQTSIMAFKNDDDESLYCFCRRPMSQTHAQVFRPGCMIIEMTHV